MTDPITRLNTALEGRYKIERHNRNVALKVLKADEKLRR